MRAKFRVVTVKNIDYGTFQQHEVDLRPVIGGSDENDSFWKATPAGQITLTIDNPAVRGFLEAGKEYYIDFTPAS